jgi:uncharacterized protein YhhL (DUF1145 family)
MLNQTWTRSQRISGALLLALLIGAVVTALRDSDSISAVRTGDFKAFYTLAVIADGADTSRLYDPELQRAVQSSVWPGHLNSAFLPAAYPPYVALLVRPLAWFGPVVGRIVWLLASMIACMWAALLFCRLQPDFGARKLEVLAIVFTFYPLLMGVVGGQVVAYSALIYLAILFLSRTEKQWSFQREFAFGSLIGAWFFKPQYALVALLPLLVRRRWVALCGASVVAAVYYAIGASVMGLNWPVGWISFAQQFAEMNFISNSYQMTNLVAGVRQLHQLGLCSGSIGQWLLAMASVLSATLVASWTARATPMRSDLFSVYMLLPTLLAIATPQANFYDVGLSVFPFLLSLPGTATRARALLVTVWLLALVTLLCSSPESLPFFVGFALGLHLLIATKQRWRYCSEEEPSIKR